MHTELVSLALVGSLGLTGAALLSPARQRPDPRAVVDRQRPRLGHPAALQDLVGDHTPPAQADEVASTLIERITQKVDRVGTGGWGHHRGVGRPRRCCERHSERRRRTSSRPPRPCRPCGRGWAERVGVCQDRTGAPSGRTTAAFRRRRRRRPQAEKVLVSKDSSG